jgi:molybdenum cofactor cytidylyltransferase
MNGGTLPVLRIVLLAAGFSRRLGRPKALARVRGVALLRRTLVVLGPFAGSWPIIVVVPPAAARFRQAAKGLPASWVVNRRRATGMASSLRTGLRRARYSAGALILPVDLAALAGRDIARLVRRWKGARRKVVARLVEGGPAVPLVLPHGCYPCTGRITGDQGLRGVLRGLSPQYVLLEPLASAQFDVDTPADLARARRGY